MVGRAVYEHPLRWQQVDELIYKEKPQHLKASKVIENLIPYADKHLSSGGQLWDICRHLLQLVEGVKGARKWRRNLSLTTQKRNRSITLKPNYRHDKHIKSYQS